MRRVAALAWLLSVSSFVAGIARANRYEVFVDVETEQDLRDLRNEGQIGERSFEALNTLMDQPLDLSTANRIELLSLPNLDAETVDRILALRAAAGTLIELQDLVDAAILTPDLARSLRPFVMRPAANDPMKEPVRALLRLRSRFTGRYDRYPPPMALQARLSTPRGLHLGLAASLLRNQPGPIRFDPQRNALSANPPRARALVPKFFLLWRTERWSLIAGTYRIGFGQSLVFDTTAEKSPKGFSGDDALNGPSALVQRCRERALQGASKPCPRERAIRVTPDYGWTHRLTGIAIGFRGATGRGGWNEAHAWGSYQVHSASRYELRLAAQCPDPRDEDESCAPPTVLVHRRGALGAQTGWSATSFPRVYAEGLVGANLSHFWSPRRHLGITGYGAKLRWMTRGVELGLQESARRPYGGPFGALGLELSYGKRKHDFQLELARSFDRQNRGRGGWAAIARSLSTLRKAEVDLSARYYASRYANPHARPSAAADELEGLRARDEAGLRMRTRLALSDRWTLRSTADFWRELSEGPVKSELKMRVDFERGAYWSGSLWATERTGDSRRSVATGLRAIVRPSQRLRALLQLQHDASRTRARNERFAHAFAAITTFTLVPLAVLRLTLRLRYDGVLLASQKNRVRHALWAYLRTAFVLQGGKQLRLRYDFRLAMPRSSPQAVGRPNPENWFALEYLWRSH